MHTIAAMVARMSCLIVLIGMIATAGCLDELGDSGVAATVNGAVIRRDDVAVNVAAGMAPQPALDDLIDTELVVQAAHTAHISVTSAELDLAFAEIKRQNHLDDAAFASVLTEHGYTIARYRHALERQMLRVRAINVLVAPGTNATEPEARHATHAWIEQLRRDAVIEIAAR
jgi:parvulin-like peptidyl-prolyl isomerase